MSKYQIPHSAIRCPALCLVCLLSICLTGCPAENLRSPPVAGSGSSHAQSPINPAETNTSEPKTVAQQATLPQHTGSNQTDQEWVSLFDGKTLKGWKKSNFGGEGDIEVKEGVITMYFGNDLTGIHTERKLPKVNYEAELEAMRVDGTDFFCGFTFPVKEKFCSFILGGWGGGTTGLSSLDGMDASENETQSYEELKNKKWYKVRVRVTETHIQVWLNDESLFNQDILNRKLSIRIEVDPSKPFGISCFQTTAALRNIRIRKLNPAELKPAPAEGEKNE